LHTKGEIWAQLVAAYGPDRPLWSLDPVASTDAWWPRDP